MANVTEQDNEKRHFSRVPFDADVLLTKDGKEWRSQLIDISLKGVLIKTPENWDAVNGEKFNLEVIFADILGTGQVPRSWQGHIVLPCEWSSVPSLQPIF